MPARPGPPPGPPPDSAWLAGDMARSMAALDTYMRSVAGSERTPGVEIEGLAVSRGVHEGGTEKMLAFERLFSPKPAARPAPA